MARTSDRPWRKLFEAKEVREKIDVEAMCRAAEGYLHRKADLEKLLAGSILELEFLPVDAENGRMRAVFCTGNVRFANVFMAARPSDKKKMLKSPFIGLSSRDQASVEVFDVTDGRRKTIPLKSWKVVLPFVLPLTPKTVLPLDAIVNAYAKRA